MKMAGEDSAGISAPSKVQADFRQCCSDSPQIIKEWDGKPLPKVLQFGASLLPTLESFPIGVSHPIHHPTPEQQRGSPPGESSSHVLRI